MAEYIRKLWNCRGLSKTLELSGSVYFLSAYFPEPSFLLKNYGCSTIFKLPYLSFVNERVNEF